MLDFNFFFSILQAGEIQKCETLCSHATNLLPKSLRTQPTAVCPPTTRVSRTWNHPLERDEVVSEARLLSFVKEKQKSKPCVA